MVKIENLLLTIQHEYDTILIKYVYHCIIGHIIKNGGDICMSMESNGIAAKTDKQYL